MKLGLGSYAYRWAVGMGSIVPTNPMTLAEMVARAKASGCELVQFADNVKLENRSEHEIDAAIDAAREAGIEIELGLNGLRPDAVERYFKLAERFSAKLIRIAPDQIDADAEEADTIAALRQLGEQARKQGITLAIENHFHFPSPKLVRLLDAVNMPSVGVCLDVANSIAVGEWPADTIALLAPYAKNLHLKDYRIAIDPDGVGMRVIGTPLGQGLLDIGAVFDALERAGREVNVILEHWLPRGETLSQTLQAEDDWLACSVTAARRFVPFSQSTHDHQD